MNKEWVVKVSQSFVTTSWLEVNGERIPNTRRDDVTKVGDYKFKKKKDALAFHASIISKHGPIASMEV